MSGSKCCEVRAERPAFRDHDHAYGDAETRRKAIEAGAGGAFDQPIDFALLRHEIDSGSSKPHDRTILVVDDEPDSRLWSAKIPQAIRDGEVAFISPATASKALQSIQDHPHVDLVVSDINMPRMDGLSLLQKLQEAEDKKSTSSSPPTAT